MHEILIEQATILFIIYRTMILCSLCATSSVSKHGRNNIALKKKEEILLSQ